jgi:sugar lactone lactonase YvrE
MTTVGDGDHRYEVDRDWLLRNVPAFWDLGQCADVAVDSKDRVWLFSRSKHPVTCWTTDGKFIGSWANQGDLPGEFRVPHGIYIDYEDTIWLADHQTHTVTRHREDGEVLMTLGTHGYANITVTTTNRQGTPFNMPTGTAIAPDGKIFISDGYANRRVHRFSASGDLEHSWGEAGTGPGQFSILHKVAIDPDGLVYICDRENNRIQIFDADGAYQGQWDDVVGPGDILFAPDGLVYVVEQGGGNGVSIWTRSGELVTRWRGNADACRAGHGIGMDSTGNIYVAEIGEPERGCRVTKFTRV